MTDRLKSAAEQVLGNEVLNSFLEFAPDAVVIADAQGRIVLVNAQGERLFGYPRAELLGKQVEMLLPERLHEAHAANRDGYVADPQVRTMGAGLDLLGRRRDGSEFPVDVSLSPLETEQGVLVAAAIRDVTERRRAEAALGASEARFRAFLEFAPDAIVIADEEGLIVSWNRGAERMFGQAEPDMLGRPLTVLMPERHRAAHLAGLARVAATGESSLVGRTVELEALRGDGEEFPIELTLSMWRAGEEVFFSGIVRDVTERRRAEAALSKSEARFRAFLEFAPDAVVIADTQGRIVLVNAQGERLFGYPRAELLGKQVEMLLPERLHEAHAANRDGYVADPQVRTMGAGLDLLGRRRDGSEFPVDVSLSPLETEQGVLVAAAIRDVTERRRAEAALGAANGELEAFSYSVSHDLRAPLRSINGLSAVILEEYGHQLDPEARALFERVRAAAGRMGQLIDDLLSLGRVSRGEMRQQAVDLSAIAREVTDQLREQAPDRDVVVRISDDAIVRGDQRLLRVALENLLDNAWKFTGEQPRAVIEFGVGEHKGQRAFFVRDDGAGFDMAYADKLFGAFQRLHASEEFEGNGIGLATVQRIVRRHGGQVWADGAVGEGACFTFTLTSAIERE